MSVLFLALILKVFAKKGSEKIGVNMGFALYTADVRNWSR